MTADDRLRMSYSELIADRPDLARVAADLDALATSVRLPVGLEAAILHRSAGLAAGRPSLRPLPAGSGRAGHSHPRGTAPAGGLVRITGIAAAFAIMLGGAALVWGGVPLGFLSGAGSAPSVPPGGAIAWDTGAVQLSADQLAIVAGDGTFLPPEALTSLRSDPGSPSARTLEATWFEDDVEMRLNVYLKADAERWWVNEIRTYSGFPDVGGRDWVYYQAPDIGAPLGQAWTGDLDLGSSHGEVPGWLVGQGVSMSAFLHGSVAGVVGDCTLPGVGKAGQSATGAGEPLRGTAIERKSPREAAALLDERGYCHAFEARIPNGSGADGETWCTPPAGDIQSVDYGSWGQVLVKVDVKAPGPGATPRPAQPPVGFGCPWPVDQSGPMPSLPPPDAFETPEFSPGFSPG